MARLVLRARRFVLKKILHADDTPHAIALGVAIATWVAFIPLPVSQTLVALGLAALFRANKAVCIPVVWLSNPITAIPIWAFCYAVGQFLVHPQNGIGQGNELRGLLDLEFRPFEVSYWTGMFRLLISLGRELWIGCLVVGATSGLFAYWVTRWAVNRHRQHRKGRELRRHSFRARLRNLEAARNAKVMEPVS